MNLFSEGTNFESTSWRSKPLQISWLKWVLLRVWFCVVKRRVWHSTAKAIYLNLTLDGQLRVEPSRSDVVGGRLDPSATAGPCFPARVVASWSWSRWGLPWSGFTYVACLSHWPHLIHLSSWRCDVVLLMNTGYSVCACTESFFQRSLL